MDRRYGQNALALGTRDRIDDMFYKRTVQMVQNEVLALSRLYLVWRRPKQLCNFITMCTGTVDDELAFDRIVDHKMIAGLFDLSDRMIQLQFNTVQHCLFHRGNRHFPRGDDAGRRQRQDLGDAVRQMRFFL